MSDSLTYADFDDLYVEFLPARTLLTCPCTGGGDTATAAAAGGDGGDGGAGGAGGIGLNLLNVNAAVLGDATQTNSAGNGGDGGAGGDGGDGVAVADS